MVSALLISLLAFSAWSGLTSANNNDELSSCGDVPGDTAVAGRPYLREWSGLASANNQSSCRNVPGDAGFPTDAEWAVLNTTVSGRLVKVVPFVEFCTAQGGCTAQQSGSSVFRAGIPGAMNQVKLSPPYPMMSAFNRTNT